jgi:hypothetical protein
MAASIGGLFQSRENGPSAGKRLCQYTAEIPSSRQSSSEERKPDAAKDQYRETGTDRQQQQYRRAGFLASFGRCFDDYAVLFNWHETLRQFFSR